MERLFGFLILLQLLDLPALLLDLLLLRLDLLLGLGVGVFVVLHLVAYRIAGRAAEAATNQGTSGWMADRRAHQRTADRADTSTAESTFLTRAHRLPAAARQGECACQHQCGNCRYTFVHKIAPSKDERASVGL